MSGAGEMMTFGPPVQIAYAATDLRSAAARFAATTGAGPFVVVDHIDVPEARVRGEASTFDHSSAYGQWGSVMVELVEEHSPALVPPGSGVHHLAFMVPSLADAIAACVDRGWPELLFARTSGGQEFAFCDARAELGHLVELYEPSERLREFYSMIAASAVDWDGTDPVRPVR